MPKMGIIHDYDLMANAETSANEAKCYVCGKENISFQWSDYSGEAMCTRCGAPHQLKWGTDEQIKEGKYPYTNLTKDFIPVAREYWKEKGTFACYGSMLGKRKGMDELYSWLEEKHPELLSESK